MIAYLNGTIRKKLPKSIILDTGAIGYLVHTPLPFWEKSKEQSRIELYIHTKVREDDISLFGFESLPELDFFKQLMNVNGIGPKLAMEILSHDTARVKTAILTSDTAFLCKIPGIGKKTAERIVIELKNSIDAIDLQRNAAGIGKDNEDEEAINAIMTLGYQRYEIMRVIKNMPKEISTTEETVTYFLRNV